MHKTLWISIVIAAAGCVSAPAPTGTPIDDPPAVKNVAEVLAKGLNTPWDVAFARDGRIFISERPGTIRVLAADGTLESTPWATLTVAASEESGLLGLTLHPDFPTSPYVYAYYSYGIGTSSPLLNRLVRITEEAGRGGEVVTLLDAIPAAPLHDGGRLRFGPDGLLYLTTGDANVPPLSQDLRSPAGKTLRLAADGALPPDNPFEASPVFTFGHRNSQGICWDAATGTLYASEHGPDGGDEINVLEPGRNYGWAVAPEAATKTRAPKFVWSEPVAPSGCAFYRNAASSPTAWDGSLFVASLRGKSLFQLTPAADNASFDVHRLFQGQFGRLRAVEAGPDGCLYFTTSNRDGRGSPQDEDDRLLRTCPA